MVGQKIGFSADSPVIDKVKILRLGAMSSEDFIIPFLKEREINENGKIIKEKVVETAELSIFKEAKENPNKNYLIFLDETNRVSHDMQKILFSLAEQKTPQGEHLPNIFVIAAINHGDAYDIDIEISDIALKRRFAFVEFAPEVENFKTEGMHDLIIETVPYLTSSKDYIDTDLKSAEKVFEQATTYGSFKSYSVWLRELEAQMALEKKLDSYKLSYDEAAMDIQTTAGPLFFKGETATRLSEIFFMLENTKKFNFTEIIANGSINTEHFGGGKYTASDLITRTYYAIRKEIMDDVQFLNKVEKIKRKSEGTTVENPNGVNLVDFMAKNKKTSLFMALLQDINNEIDKERKALVDKDDKTAKMAVDKKHMEFIKATVKITTFLTQSKDPELKEIAKKVEQIAALSKAK